MSQKPFLDSKKSQQIYLQQCSIGLNWSVNYILVPRWRSHASLNFEKLKRGCNLEKFGDWREIILIRPLCQKLYEELESFSIAMQILISEKMTGVSERSGSIFHFDLVIVVTRNFWKLRGARGEMRQRGTYTWFKSETFWIFLKTTLHPGGLVGKLSEVLGAFCARN